MILTRIKHAFGEYPRAFWIVVAASFIDRIGGTMIWPYFALYVTERFQVGMTEAGYLFAIFSVTGFAGNILGGALTDKFGRRGMVFFGLTFSALSSISMGLVNELVAFYLLAAAVGLLSDIGGPARTAMIADILPEEQRADGFGVLRVAGNLAWILGPTIGGLLAARSYLYLFLIDAATSMITAVIVYRLVGETKPAADPTRRPETLGEAMAGYGRVAADRLFVAFLATCVLMLLVYLQMYNTLSVYLRDVHGVPPKGYGLLLTLDAATVVLLQFWVTRRVRGINPMLLMAAGSAFYLVGFTMYGLVDTYWLFVVAILIITVGEMVSLPVSQALVARFAPEEMRGRYMAFSAVAWTIPGAVGPWAAGLIMDHFDPRWVWYAAGIVSAAAVAGFYALYLATRGRFAATAPVVPD